MKQTLSNSLAISCCALAACCVLTLSPIIRRAKADEFVKAATKRDSHAFVTTDSNSKHYSIRSLELKVEPLLSDHSPPVITALAASRDGRFLAAAGDDHAIRIIDIAKGKTLRTLVDHDDWIQCLAFALDSQTLYSSGNDGRVVRWKRDAPTDPELVVRLPYAIRSLSVSSKKQLVAIGGFSTEIIVFDLAAGKIKHRLECHCGDQRCVKFSPDGTHLLCGGRDGELRIWDTDSGETLAHFHKHAGRVYTAAFSADGTSVSSAGEDRKIIQYDLATKSVSRERELAPAKLMSLCMINDEVVAVAGADNSIHLYDAAADSVVAHLQGHLGTVAVMAPCGDLLASGSFDTTIRIWDLESIEKEALSHGKPTSRAPIKIDPSLRIR